VARFTFPDFTPVKISIRHSILGRVIVDIIILPLLNITTPRSASFSLLLSSSFQL
jgi:hypothetical protein